MITPELVDECSEFTNSGVITRISLILNSNSNSNSNNNINNRIISVYRRGSKGEDFQH